MFSPSTIVTTGHGIIFMPFKTVGNKSISASKFWAGFVGNIIVGFHLLFEKLTT
jgi:hypothetical protein